MAPTVTSTPVWRLAAIGLAGGALLLIGRLARWWSPAVLDFISTAIAAAALFAVAFWARKRPDRLRRRFGPFGRIAQAVQDSAADISAYVHAQPLRVGLGIGLGYGLLVAVSRLAVGRLLVGLQRWGVAAALTMALAALIVAPDLWRAARARFTIDEGERARN